VNLVAGLGNPGPRYAESRHNVGFRVADELARRWRMPWSYEADFAGLMGRAAVGPAQVLLLKPQTYMNLSGRSVAGVLRFYKVAPADLMVVYDDLDLPVGRVRVRSEGSAGGQKGMMDVLRAVGTNDVPRVRVGIGRTHPSAAVEYVLARFEPSEREAIEQAVTTAADAVECWLRDGIDAAMNRFNARADPPGGR
jgi:PTH1 family peptidyl-tRNA hydrolase